MTSPVELDVLVVGGGVAGLWTCHRLVAAGHRVALAEKYALGSGQSIPSQGIVHGGGKYSLRSVADVESMRAIREMPDRWRDHLAGNRAPDLRAARRRDDECWLWLPRGSWRARLEALGLMPLLRHGGVLACPPVPRPRSEWPSALVASALRAYSMAEPVLDTRSVIDALADGLRTRLLAFSEASVSRGPDGKWAVRLASPDGTQPLDLRARHLVLCAGRGNAEWLEAVGAEASSMQERPLLMFLLRGNLPVLQGHCIAGGRTRITVTSASVHEAGTVWQLGGEVAERHARSGDTAAARADALREVSLCLPQVDLAGVEISTYAPVRAEGRHPDQRRPSGVQIQHPAPGVLAAWPTKWAMAPLLADEIFAELSQDGASGAEGAVEIPLRWPRPEVASAVWEEEERQWTRVDSATPI